MNKAKVLVFVIHFFFCFHMKKKLLLILFFACIALADTCTDGDCVQTADSVCSPRAKLIGFDITVSLNENSFSDAPINVSSISEFTVFKGQSPPLQSFAMAVDYSDGTPTVLIIGGRPRGVHNVVDCKNTAAVSRIFISNIYYLN